MKLSLMNFFLKLISTADFLIRSLAINLLNFYKLVISPYLGWNCRFYPTCSSYSVEAYQNFNFFKATYLTFKRIICCRPFGPQGYDPVDMSSTCVCQSGEKNNE